MSTTPFLKTFLCTFLLATIINILISPSWGFDEESDPREWTEVKHKKRSGSRNGASKSGSLKNGLTDITKGTQKVKIDGSAKQKKSSPLQTKSEPPKTKAPSPRPTTLIRAANDVSPLVHYTRNLKFNGKKFDLERTSTTNNINYVWDASQHHGGKTHLLAQGFYKRAGYKSVSKPLTITEDLLGVKISSKKVVWVSQGSNAISNNNYFIRKPQTNYQGGHAEPQFINDLEAAFTQNSDAVLKYFMPPADVADNTYMCGLELFGPYDMCDPFNGGNNGYDCVGKLIDFRKKHQDGNQSISKAIRDKLGSKFKGANEDAFIVIYHSKYPYDKVHQYKAKEADALYPLQFNFPNYQFLPTNPDNFDANSKLSQHRPSAKVGFIV